MHPSTVMIQHVFQRIQEMTSLLFQAFYRIVENFMPTCSFHTHIIIVGIQQQSK